MKKHTRTHTPTHYNKCHIHGHASLKYVLFDFLIFSDLLSYENNKESILSGCSLCSFTIFFTYQKSFDVFLKFLP